MAGVNPIRRLRAVSPRETASLDDLLSDVGRGDQAAFSQFYDASAALVHGIVAKVVRDPAITQEVSQEVFVELWRLAPRFEADRGSAKAWAATIAHRRAVDRVRSEQSRRDREERQAHHAHHSAPDASESVIASIERGEVSEGLDALSDTQREAVTLAYYGGHTYREVAVLLGVPEGTVKTRIRDGLIKLRDAMEPFS